MRSILLVVLVTGCAGADPAPASPGPAPARPAPVDLAAAREEVKSAETAFAAAFRDRDKDRFFAMMAEDAVFLGTQKTLRGRPQVIETWSRFFADPSPPFSWQPERVEVSADGSLGLSTGPVLDPAGKQIGMFSSIWRRQPDGTWKVAFDGPGCSAPPPQAPKP